MQDKILYILLFISFSFYGQGEMLLASKQQSNSGESLTTDPIFILNPDVMYTPSSIDASAIVDGDVVSVWNDVSGNGLNATSQNSIELHLEGQNRMIQFNGGDSWMDVADSSILEKVMGTAQFTIIARLGTSIPTTGYIMSKTLTGTQRGYGIIYDITILAGGLPPLNVGAPVSRGLYVVIFDGSTVSVWVDGVLQVDAGTVTSSVAQATSLNIGSRTDGGFPISVGAQLDLISIIPSAITTSQRQAIENKYINDPILSIPNITAYWKREGIDASATTQGNNVNTWTDEVGGRVLNKVGATQPTLNIANGKREVAFGGNSGMDIAEWAGVDFTGRTDEFTLIAKVGNILGQGTLIGKQESGAANIQYQIAYRTTATGSLAQNVGAINNSNSLDGYFGSGPTSSGTLVSNKVVSFTVGTADNFDTDLYYDNEVITLSFLGNPNGETIGPVVTDFNFMVGARRDSADDAVGYVFTGSISHILVFSRKLTAGEIATIVSNLD